MKYASKSKSYRPEMNDDYFTIEDDGTVYCFEYTFCTYDEVNYENGNCFKTEEEALAHKEKVDKTWKLKR